MQSPLIKGETGGCLESIKVIIVIIRGLPQEIKMFFF